MTLKHRMNKLFAASVINAVSSKVIIEGLLPYDIDNTTEDVYILLKGNILAISKWKFIWGEAFPFCGRSFAFQIFWLTTSNLRSTGEAEAFVLWVQR